MIVLVDQKHRQLVVLQDDRGGGRLDLGDTFEQQRAVGLRDPSLEQGDRSFALLHAAHGNDEPVAELGATQEPKGLPAVERAGAGQERAEHRGNERADPQRGRHGIDRSVLVHVLARHVDRVRVAGRMSEDIEVVGGDCALDTSALPDGKLVEGRVAMGCFGH